MNFSEFITFLISAGVVIYVVLKRLWESRQREKYPEQYALKEKEQKEQLQQFLKSLDVDLSDEEEPLFKPIPKKAPEPPPYKPLPQPKTQLKPIEEFQPHRRDAYAIATHRDSISRGRRIIERQHSLKDAVVMQVILNKPKGL